MKFSELVDAVARLDEQVIITRNGRPAAVLVSPDEFESWSETTAIKSNAELMQEIRDGLEALDSDARLYSLAELFDE
jgi:prevent-host-death family protein